MASEPEPKPNLFQVSAKALDLTSSPAPSLPPDFPSNLLDDFSVDSVVSFPPVDSDITSMNEPLPDVDVDSDGENNDDEKGEEDVAGSREPTVSSFVEEEKDDDTQNDEEDNDFIAQPSRRSWAHSESEPALRFFSSYIQRKKLPGKSECMNFLNKNRSIKRTWRQVKDFVRNYINKIKQSSFRN